MRKVILLFGSLLMLSIIMSAGLLAWTYFSLHSLPLVNNPSQFATNFRGEGQQSQSLKSDSRGFFVPEGIIISPYFPYNRGLEGISVTSSGGCKYVVDRDATAVSGESRYILRDRLWNIFWVRIVPCGSPAKTFGPFRMQD